MLRIRERGGASRLSVEILLSYSTANLRRGNLCFRKFLVSKNVKDKREREGASRLSIETLLSHSTEKLRRGNLCFRKFLVSRNVKDKREGGGGHHDFLSKFCCLAVQNIFVGETCVSESFWYRKMLRIRERGGHHDFPSKISRLTIPKNFVGETCVSENFWYRKMSRIRERGGGITTFCRNFVVSQYRISSSGKLVFQKVSGIEKC